MQDCKSRVLRRNDRIVKWFHENYTWCCAFWIFRLFEVADIFQVNRKQKLLVCGKR